MPTPSSMTLPPSISSLCPHFRLILLLPHLPTFLQFLFKTVLDCFTNLDVFSRQHIGKLQKKEVNQAPGTPTAAAPKKTAGKRKAAAKNKKSDSDEEESEAENPRPVKKRATRAKPKKPVP